MCQTMGKCCSELFCPCALFSQQTFIEWVPALCKVLHGVLQTKQKSKGRCHSLSSSMQTWRKAGPEKRPVVRGNKWGHLFCDRHLTYVCTVSYNAYTTLRSSHYYPAQQLSKPRHREVTGRSYPKQELEPLLPQVIYQLPWGFVLLQPMSRRDTLLHRMQLCAQAPSPGPSLQLGKSIMRLWASNTHWTLIHIKANM